MNVNDLTRTVIGCAYTVHNKLGAGFREEVYENALRIELAKYDIEAKQDQKIKVFYDGHQVGKFYPDLLIEGLLIIEVKGVRNLDKEHDVQLVNYLTATRIDDGLLLNFGPSVQVKRKFRDYRPKGSLLESILPRPIPSE